MSHTDNWDVPEGWLVEATREIAAEDNDVERLITSISSGLRQIRRPGRAIATTAPNVLVSDRVIKQQLAIAIRTRIGRLLVSASVDGAGTATDGIRVGLIARYGDDLLALSDTIRNVIGHVLINAIGREASEAARSNITVHWRDLYTNEWIAR